MSSTWQHGSKAKRTTKTLALSCLPACQPARSQVSDRYLVPITYTGIGPNRAGFMRKDRRPRGGSPHKRSGHLTVAAGPARPAKPRDWLHYHRYGLGQGADGISRTGARSSNIRPPRKQARNAPSGGETMPTHIVDRRFIGKPKWHFLLPADAVLFFFFFLCQLSLYP